MPDERIAGLFETDVADSESGGDAGTILMSFAASRCLEVEDESYE